MQNEINNRLASHRKVIIKPIYIFLEYLYCFREGKIGIERIRSLIRTYKTTRKN
jgi:hypothetical protein